MDGPVHVSVPTTSGRARRRGIHLHRTPALAETTYRDRIPVTTVPRTIEDLRHTSLSPRLVRRAIRQAEFMGLRLDGIETDRSRSDLETTFLDLCRRRHLPPPEVNVKLGRWEVDFLWRSQSLVVEVDTWTYHRGSVAFEDDHARELDLRQQGFTVLRFTDRQLEEDPDRVLQDLAAQLDC
jgi:very-short-patch-repair endonuclease